MHNDENTEVNVPADQTNEDIVENQTVDINELSDEEFEKKFNEEIGTLDDDFKHVVEEPNTLVNTDNDQQTNIEENTDTPNVEVDEEDKPLTLEDIDLELYKAVSTPFKGNGKLRQPTPEEVVKLLELGSKYYDDREKIKPQLKTVKMLEKANVDQDKLLLVLDAVNGDKKAIAELIRGNKIDVLDIDEALSSEEEYQPTNQYSVTDKDLVLDEVFASIEGTESFNDTVKVLEGLDNVSKSHLTENPMKIKVINEHISNGLYGEIVSQINHERTFGRMLDTPFIEAYEIVGNALLAQKQAQISNQPTNHVANQVQQQEQQVQTNQKVSVSRALGTGAGLNSSQVSRQAKNINSLSDEEYEAEFEKYMRS